MSLFNTGFGQPQQNTQQQVQVPVQQPLQQPPVQEQRTSLGGLSGNKAPYEPAAQYYLEWKAKSNCFQFYDKATDSKKHLSLPYNVQILDYRFTLKGFNKHYGTGVYSNEIKDFSEPFLLKRHPLKKQGEKDATPLCIITDYHTQQSKVNSFQASLYLVVYVVDQYDMRNALLFTGDKAIGLIEEYAALNRPANEGVTLQSTSVDNKYGRLFYAGFTPNPQFANQIRDWQSEVDFLNNSYLEYKQFITNEINALNLHFTNQQAQALGQQGLTTPQVQPVQNVPQQAPAPVQQPAQQPNPFGTPVPVQQQVPQQPVSPPVQQQVQAPVQQPNQVPQAPKNPFL